MINNWNLIAESWIKQYVLKFEDWQVKQRICFSTVCKHGLILDLGCGSGRDVTFFNNLNSKLSCIGLDFSLKMLKSADKNNQYINSEATMLPFKKNVFSGVWSCSVLKYLQLKELLMVLNEIHRVLKKEGFLWVSLEYGEGATIKKRCGVKMKIELFTENKLRSLLEKTGFKVINVQVFEKNRKFISALSKVGESEEK